MARAVVPGVAHHVTQRGNRREDVFLADGDRRRYLELLKEYSERHGLGIIAYCLMTNHLHLVVRPVYETSLAATLKPVHLRYAQHVNWTYKLSGRLWQGRFYSCPLDDAHCLAAIRYVETNPVRAKLVKKAENYPWSSAAGHTGRSHDTLLTDHLADETAIADWSVWLRERASDAAVDELRRHTRTGRPLGNESFVSRLELLSGRILRPKPGGRPRKAHTSPEKHG